ncbi:exodeoxyribonuclease III [Methanobacterium ferruginis]|uniref:exodeoxyribonuclease III n=1 Tax=Methanobacterium ferruginis TaxID=710191 RepID=UPI0025731711|nr:exodeoxyribonuclease III [Methanobacterium ferruginis]BDZ68779.1 exodeoxyribonuclease III [Methanobacterium ferruginis]
MTIDILSWNVNGLRARYNKGHLDWILDEKPDIFCFQETKATEDQISETLNGFEDYHTYFSSSAVKSGFSGVAIYSKTEPLKVIDNLGYGKYKEEGRILKAEYHEFTLFNIYFPSEDGKKLMDKLNFYNHFLEKMESLSDFHENVIICGDFNIAHNQIDLYNPKQASKNPGYLQLERGLLDRLIAQGYFDSFRMFNQEPGNYTWWPNGYDSRVKNNGMRLDHFFLTENMKDKVKSAYTRPKIMGSDHCPIGVEIEL